MAVRAGAAELRAAIAEARVRMDGLKRAIGRHEGKLKSMVVEAFNEASDSLDGMTLEKRDVLLGELPCELSPTGACAYGSHAVSLPGQRRHEAWRKAHEGTPEEHTYPTGDECSKEACLFCGKPGDAVVTWVPGVGEKLRRA